MTGVDLRAYMSECRELVLQELQHIVPRSSEYGPILYDIMLEYPLREAKALRPALCVAACRALGGELEQVLQSAAVLELYHNAFLIHDDIEDNSERRRDGPTLHRKWGIPIALNVGDAMLALVLEPLLDNMRLVGLGKSLLILQVISRMARESAEGQALELSWVRAGSWDKPDRAYLRMVHKKTTWYTFITPMLVGGLAARAAEGALWRYRQLATALGAAFQIQDDILNLTGDEAAYGKERLGDLWEGKHTLLLMHMIRLATEEERRNVQQILSKPRPFLGSNDQALREARQLVHTLCEAGSLEPRVAAQLRNALGRVGGEVEFKTQAEVEYLAGLIEKYGSVEYARAQARRRARRAQRSLREMDVLLQPSVHRDFLHALVEFVVGRER